MGWEDRTYSYESDVQRGPGWRATLPPATFALLIIHFVAFVILQMMRFDVGRASASVFPLAGADAHPAAILLHPIATENILSMLLTLYVIWALGGRIEMLLGGRTLIGTYVSSNLVAGAAYFALARGWPAGAALPLAIPAGALLGWGVLAWRRMGGEPVSVFGWMTTLGRLLAIVGALFLAFPLLGSGPGAVAYVAAALAGGVLVLFRDALPVLWNAPRSPRRARTPQRVRSHRREDGRRSAALRDEAAGPPDNPPDIDDILAKISREGLSALTAEERERLEQARQARLQRTDARHNVR